MLRYHLGSLEFNINGLNIFDEKQSLLKSDNIDVSIDFNQVLFKHYHIDNISVTGLRFNEDAPVVSTTSTSSTSKTSTKGKTSESTSSDSSDNDGMLDGISDSLPTPKALLARSGLSSSKNVKEASTKLKGIEKKYVDAIEKDFSKEEVDSVKNELKALEKKIRAKDFSTISKDLKTIKKLRTKLKEKKNLLQN